MTLSHTSNETLKWFSSLNILMRESFWRWQCSDKYIISLFTPLHALPPPLSPSLISLMVSVDVKHHVYLLTYGLNMIFLQGRTRDQVTQRGHVTYDATGRVVHNKAAPLFDLVRKKVSIVTAVQLFHPSRKDRKNIDYMCHHYYMCNKTSGYQMCCLFVMRV